MGSSQNNTASALFTHQNRDGTLFSSMSPRLFLMRVASVVLCVARQ